MIAIGVTNRVYRYAARRLGWSGPNPVSLMLPSERPKPSRDVRRRFFKAGELEQTIAAAEEPYRTLFTVAALTGARLRSFWRSDGPTSGWTIWTMRRSSSRTRSTARGTWGQPRPMAQRGRFRFLASWPGS